MLSVLILIAVVLAVLAPSAAALLPVDRSLSARYVRHARRVLETQRCPKAVDRVRHDWEFDGYFWHRCRTCRNVS